MFVSRWHPCADRWWSVSISYCDMWASTHPSLYPNRKYDEWPGTSKIHRRRSIYAYTSSITGIAPLTITT